MDFPADFVADKAKFRRRAVARQEILTKSAAKYAEKTRTISNEYLLLYNNNIFSKEIQYPIKNIGIISKNNGSFHNIVAVDKAALLGNFLFCYYLKAVSLISPYCLFVSAIHV